MFCAVSSAGNNVVGVTEYLRGLPAGTVQPIILVPQGCATLSHPPDVRFVLRDTEGLAFRAYGAVESEERVVVIRPDGYVGGISRGAEGAKKYFSMIFDVGTKV